MTRRWTARFTGAAGLGFVAVLLFARPVGADAVTPPGSCVGSGTWEQAGFSETSTNRESSDTFTVPLKDTVKWSGNEKGFALGSTGARRAIEGKVRLKLPIGTVTIDSWGGDSARYANQGEHVYDLPSIVTGVKMKLSGYHKDAGHLTCSGSVYVKVKGSATSNPLLWVCLGGMVITGLGLFYSGRPVVRKVAPAFEDINPG